MTTNLSGTGESEPLGHRRVVRPRLVGAELTQGQGARIRVRVVLDVQGKEYAAERQGIGDSTIILRLAAEATLSALHSAIDQPGYFELVGIKRIHAFDEYVVLTGVRIVQEPSRRLLGCVPMGGRSLVEGSACSLLNATNRIVERLTDMPGEAPPG